ncbi:MAG: hypothetical protein NC121_05550 [Blautia sp.]|nr:hypothetical protein [Blautia sp.]
MEEKYDPYEYLRYELFEELVPRMLYWGTEEEKNEFFQLLLQENSSLVCDMYKMLCEDDGQPCPFQRDDFKTEMFKRGGISFLQINVPQGNSGTGGILRAYLLYMKQEDGRFVKRYFVVKKFQNGNVFNVHIAPDTESVLGEELTRHAGDMEYEYWKLVRDFVKLLLQDIYGSH